MESILKFVLIIISGVGFYFLAKHYLIKQSSMILNILKVVFVIVIIAVAYWNFKSIDDKIALTETVNTRNKATQKRLEQIRDAQVEFRKVRGEYAGNFDTLIDFLENDSIVQVKMIGEVPDTLLGKEAIALEMGIIIRDTIKTPVREELFKENFNSIVDSMQFIPFSNGIKFTLNAGKIQKNEQNVDVFNDYAKLKDFYIGLNTNNEGYNLNDSLMVGSMEEPTTNGNWND